MGRFLDLVLSAVAADHKAKVVDHAGDSPGSIDTNFRVVPLGHLIALFEIVNDVNAVRAAQVEHEVIAFVCGLPRHRLHFVVDDLVGCVHIFQCLAVPETVVRDLLG